MRHVGERTRDGSHHRNRPARVSLRRAVYGRAEDYAAMGMPRLLNIIADQFQSKWTDFAGRRSICLMTLFAQLDVYEFLVAYGRAGRIVFEDR